MDTGFGRAGLVRIGLLLMAALVAVRREPPWRLLAGLGALAAASFAWTGHGGVGDGAMGLVHRLADIFHLLAAVAWIGALPVLALLTLDRRDPGRAARALRDFSAVGPVLVALILASGLVNSWVLVGPAAALHLTASLYGRLLAAKLTLFALMLGLAAANRWALTPALDRAIARSEPPPGALVGSLILETLLGAAVVGLVAWMGTIPPAAHS
jgi:putative copper resistance protein D